MVRLLTASALIVLALYLIWLAPLPVFIAAALVFGCLCYWEFGNIAVAHGIERPALIGFLIGLSIIVFPQHAFLACVLFLLLQLALHLRLSNLGSILPATSAVFTGAVYAFSPWHFAVELRRASPHLLFFALALNWVGDSAAFYTGRKFGKHKLAPRVSPGKSWEGAIASAIGSSLFGILYLYEIVPMLSTSYRSSMPSLSLLSVCAMSLTGNVAGQIGDLAESSMKRGAGLKDSGNLLPGHGGILDRMDSSMFTLPAIYAIYTAWPS
ncbi:MAG: phosphatidate cytidylyltransferase [Bryobacteraceae bacterium]